MRKSLFILYGLFLSFTYQEIKAQAVENPPADVSFIVGTTTGAPIAGTDSLILLGSADWNVRLYRGRLKQPMINDGSGIYYSKNSGSDTIFLHGDKWRTGELVQLEFYKPFGALELAAQYVVQSAAFAHVYPWGHDLMSGTGSWASDGGGYGYVTAKKFTGNGYYQFKHNYIHGGAIYHWLEEVWGNWWSVEYYPGNNVIVSYNDANYTTIPNSNNWSDRYFRFKRSGTTISVETATSPNGVYTTAYTFSQPSDASKAMLAGGFSTGTGNGAVECNTAGQTLVVHFD